MKLPVFAPRFMINSVAGKYISGSLYDFPEEMRGNRSERRCIRFILHARCLLTYVSKTLLPHEWVISPRAVGERCNLASLVRDTLCMKTAKLNRNVSLIFLSHHPPSLRIKCQEENYFEMRLRSPELKFN